MSFSNKNQFSECSAVTCLDVWVRVSEDDAKVNFSIYSQAKRPQCSQTVTCTAWVPASTGQTQKANVGLQKTSTKEIERPSFFFLFLLLLGDSFSFCLRLPGAWDFRSLCCNMVRL